MKTGRSIAAAAIVLIAGGGTAWTQTDTLPGVVPWTGVPDEVYRQDTPPVLRGPDFEAQREERQRREQEVIGRFARAYVQQKQPRIAVFWNREFTDRTSETRITNRTAIERTDSGSEVRRSSPGVERSEDRVGSVNSQINTQVVISGGERAGGDPRRRGLAEASMWSFEDGFLQAMADANVRLIDRAAIMRTTPVGGGDQQQIEASALMGKADILVEVLMAEDKNAAVGWVFRVRAKEIASGRIVTSFVSHGTAGADAPRFVATSRGFERTVPVPSVDDIARSLALGTMQRLAAAWGG